MNLLKQVMGSLSVILLSCQIPVVIASDQSAIPVSGSFSITGGATSDNQTNGTQKTQIVDAGGDAVTVTDHKLDVNASIDTTGLATSAGQDTGNTSLDNIDDKTPALGQALAAASVPVVLPEAQVTTLTPPAAITNYAAETGGNLASIKTNTDKTPALGTALMAASAPVTIATDDTMIAALDTAIDSIDDKTPALGQALAAASVPVVLTEAQVTTLTPPAAITGFALESGGNLADIKTNTDSIKTAVEVIDNAISGTEMQVDVVAALPAGTNAIGKLAANSGVDIGDVDVTSIAAGTNTIGDVGVKPRATGGLTTYHLVSAGSTNATNIKASAGQVFGWYIYNSNAAARKVVFHNTAGTPTAGASVFFSLVIPPTSGANVFNDIGMAFSTGIAITTVTGLADSDSAAVAANDLIINIFYSQEVLWQ